MTRVQNRIIIPATIKNSTLMVPEVPLVPDEPDPDPLVPEEPDPDIPDVPLLFLILFYFLINLNLYFCTLNYISLYL